MNSLWNFIDWLLPSIRLPDDLAHAYRDPEALSSTSHHHSYSSSSNYSSNTSSPLLHHRDGNSFSSSYPPGRSTGVPHSSASQEAVASNRGSVPEWQRERDKWDKEREHREREKERAEREKLAKQQCEMDAMLKKIKALEGQVDKLSRDLKISREDSMAIRKISSQDYVSSPHSFPTVPPSEPAALRDAYDSLLSMHTHSHNTLVERTEELASLKSFLSKTDDWSGAQLIQTLRDLNAEIVHLAASLADELTSPSSVFAPYRVDASHHASSQKAKELVGGMVGVGMTNWLLAREHSEDAATVLQFAIQAWEVSCVGRAMDSFAYGLPRDVDQFLTRIFEHMHKTDSQPTTSRWRALTYAHARALLASSSDLHHSPSSPFQTLTDHNARGLLSIVALCNFPSLPRDALLSRYGAHLARISERTERLAAAVREGVMSAGFEVMWVRPVGPAENGKEARKGKKFDDSWMEDVYAGAGLGSERGSTVMCTVEFGLVLVRKASSPDKRHSREDAGVHRYADEAANASTTIGFKPEHSGMTNGHAPAANGHVKPTGVPNGVGGNGHVPEGGHMGSLTRSVLVRPRVLLDSICQLV